MVKEMKKRERKLAPDSEYEILSVLAASEICHVDKDEIVNACDVYRQSGGKDGLKCFTRGSRTCIRAGALKEWMQGLEAKEVA